MNESKLRDDILDELGYEPIVDAAHIGVAVDQNVVTLTGHVGSYAQKLAAISAVRRVRGVQGIADEIEVRYSRTPSRPTMRSPNVRLIRWCGTASICQRKQSRSPCGTAG